MTAMTHMPGAKSPSATTNIETYDARDLVKNGVQTRILLDDQEYYLRITRSGKLILTK